MNKVSDIQVFIEPADEIFHLMPALSKRLLELDIEVVVASNDVPGKKAFKVGFNPDPTSSPPLLSELVEEVIQQIPFDFESLPILVEGESKIIRLLNSKIVIEKFKPTVYSFTHNRYGEVKGTEELRVLFSGEVFRRMNRFTSQEGGHLKNAFLAVVESVDGPFLVQERVEASNLEVRVKRYHIGSPVHRYKYTERYGTVQQDPAPLVKWSRFDKPIVCFDWRLPLTDEAGNRLADEPISDDYASVWMHDIPTAKKLAGDTFKWLEELFAGAGLLLVDICFFIDMSGNKIFGEVSPDCMRVKKGLGDPSQSESLDKDLWRDGEKEQLLAERYTNFYNLIFNKTVNEYDYGNYDN
ncbi:phosphoribosylaminoimidazolesuccinocarboxamide synthase [Dyadobacter sp. NIV53]|uniref:phosphoribosylaminoimidazolesuccinocarboxamide synthase n=1 Tax=Dyadobacter sp. NIV53 TaxID=2861765 RepID=UPI001C88B604|nr:phosphoribosylaminoimidazolesuccinocarboxamide synthase [Dyadobacter sp. NIV53]